MRRRIAAAVLGLACMAGAAGCATAPAEGASMSVVGKIRLTGTDRFPVVVLQTDDDDMWELGGLPVAEARAFAGRQVAVRGTVVRAGGPGVWLPGLRVESVRDAR